LIRVIGLDYGDKRIGIAVSDPLGFTAQGLPTIRSRGPENDAKSVAVICKEWQAEKLVLGLPLHMNGDAGLRVDVTRKFAGLLETETGLPVEFVDERLTTVAAHRILSEGNVRGEKRKNILDQLSAVLILEIWLQRNRQE
jgi:putative Holliday junction resolvase